MNTIQGEFEGYSKAVLHKVPKESVQMIETRRAFYAGAQAMMAIMAKLPDSEEASCAILDGIRDELILFANDVGEGKA